MDPITQAESLRASLRRSLIEYRKEKPNLSLRAIAKNSGVNRYFLMKLLDEEDDTTSLDLNQVLLLTKFITGRNTKDASDPSTFEMKKAIETAFNFRGKDGQPLPQQISIDLGNPFRFLVYLMASGPNGTNSDQISHVLGANGQRIATEWVRQKILVQNGKNITVAEEQRVNIGEATLRQHLPTLLALYDPKPESKPTSYFHSVHRGINQATNQKLIQIHRDFYRQIAAVLENPDNAGPIPFFCFAGAWPLWDVETP